MRLIALSLATCALTSFGLMALFIYALHVPTRTAALVEGPSALRAPIEVSERRTDWPDRWAATNLRTVSTIK